MTQQISRNVWTDAIRQMPESPRVRRSVRELSTRIVDEIDRAHPLQPGRIEALAREVLSQLAMTERFLGFAMVAVSNAFWRAQFAAVPFCRRLLLLPHCLRHVEKCAGQYNIVGLECARCGLCDIASLVNEAEGLGYRIIVAEGTPSVVKLILSGHADAVLGVACLDSLEKAFKRVVDLGIPHVAVPLLANGCVNTTAELDEIRALMSIASEAPRDRTRSYIPLLREAKRILEPEAIARLFHTDPEGISSPLDDREVDPGTGTEIIANEWLGTGGKRFRPFITLASYASQAMGPQAFCGDADLADAFDEPVRRIAVAIEALHKASLVHDDIEDDDRFRYGIETLHRRFGIPAAINVGDYLIGLGYQLIAEQKDALGPDASADMLRALAEAHLRLARGQGAELLWRNRDPASLRALDLLTIYALKTAPAFEAAMYVGLRAAGRVSRETESLIRRYSRYLGVAYQVLNDLKDWRTDEHDKLVAGQDILASRPTILSVFAAEATPDDDAEFKGLLVSDIPREERMETLRGIYERRGVFDRARMLVDKYRDRARAAAMETHSAPFRDLLEFIIDVVLQ